MNTKSGDGEKWTKERLDAVIEHYEGQAEDEELAELLEAEQGRAWVLVPEAILPEVRALIRAHEARKAS